ncbi:hypothetical protein [Sphingomonas sp. LY160]|uniref:hypothetical protein n=1 Tax=Sphingomonas sp. LY160 TaxID=3095342 RepID=UPI002ADEAAE3|nr:hypothetical protein [Sphingomonas sp. LY160]MEA1071086.1 hypothetical protein [Sphingomonas sp. LY160]
MSDDARAFATRRDRHLLNQEIAGEILLRHEQGKTIDKAVEEIDSENTLFPGINFEGLKKRWWEWRRYAERLGGYYHLVRDDLKERSVAEVIPDLALRSHLNAKPLPPKNRPRRG